MASTKRTRDSCLCVEDQDEVLVESASSSFARTSQQKRARLSDNTRNEVDEPGSLATQYEETQPGRGRMDDVSSNDSSENETALFERATQRLKRKSDRRMDNQAAESGIIESVTCTNFMCHTKLQITLGPLINFIIGHNGSGKSAVLTALTLCLGGKATATNRGQNLKSFVKEGEETATLSVKIKNQGEFAYSPTQYGDSIIVERHFSISGASGFKVKSANGHVISTKRAVLDEISDYFALQLDNPVNVLTQDMARQFLNNSTPADKYRFFMRGVQLEQMDNDYRLVEESIDSTEAQLDNLKDDVDAKKAESNRAHSRLQRSEQQNNLREKIRKYSRQMAWAQVEEQERSLAVSEEDLLQAQQKILEKQAAAENASEAFAEAEQLLEQAKSSHSETEESRAPLDAAKDEAKQRMDESVKEMIEAQSAQRDIRGHLDVARTTVAATKVKVEAERKRLEAADGGSQAIRLAGIEAAEKATIEARRILEEHQTELPHIEQAQKSADLKYKDFQRPVDDKAREVETAGTRLHNLRQNHGDAQSGFGPTLSNVLRAVANETRFQEKPIGPIGLHVTLLRPEWSSIIEKVFGGSLNSFVVTSKQDQKLMSDILQRTGNSRNFSVLIGRRQHIDTTHNEPDPEHLTILRALEIDNDLVRNQLIINQSIEQIALIQNYDEAYLVLFSGPRPRNIKATLSFHETKRGAGMRLRAGQGGDPASDPITAWSGRPRMKTDIEVQIRLQQDIVDGLKQELGELQRQLSELQQHAVKSTQTVTRHNNETKRLRLAFQRSEERILVLKDELEKEAPQDGLLDDLKTQQVEAEEEERLHQSQLEEATKEKTKQGQRGATLRHELDECDRRVREVDALITKSKAKIQKLTERRERALREKNEAFANVEDAKRDKQASDEDREALAAHVAGFVELATQISARVDVDRGENCSSLNAKIDRWTADLKRAEDSLGGSQGEIAREAIKAKFNYNQALKIQDNLTTLLSTLKTSLAERNRRWRLFRSRISTNARAGFQYLLAERAFRGNMKIDHRNHLLDLQVEPDISRKGAEGRQTKTLSGGEKSFSTICMLLALWDAMGSPIRCLDEFDVFMDSINRDISMKMMIAAARKSVGRQFILITPQAMGNVDGRGDVKIIRMNDPERGQTALPFASAT